MADITNDNSSLLDPTRTSAEADKLMQSMRSRVVGQDEAVTSIVDAYQSVLVGMNPTTRPIASFLMMGPSGCGKTLSVEALADSLVGDPKALIKIDCAEFQHSHEVAKLIGSPPGYLGHKETSPLLSQEKLNQYHNDKCKISFVLFDEIEKASDALWNLLLGILDKATLTLGDNRRVDFSKAMIFMTSNLGAAEMARSASVPLGFADKTSGGNRNIDNIATNAARKRFTPEFINRLDKMIVFHQLTEEHLSRVLDIELGSLQRRIFMAGSNVAFVLRVQQSVKDVLLKEGIDSRYGARFLKRTIERKVVSPLANLMATKQIETGDIIEVDYDNGAILFRKVEANVPAARMARMALDVIERPVISGGVSAPQLATDKPQPVDPLKAVVPYVPTKRGPRGRKAAEVKPTETVETISQPVSPAVEDEPHSNS